MINNLEKNKLQLQMQAYQEKEKHLQELSQSIKSLRTQIETWEQTYLLKAPIDGKVSLFNFWTKNQNIKQGDEVLSVIPTEKQEVIAKLSLPVQNSGKLKQGQVVNIKLDNYQFQEYGMLKGYVKTISVMPKDDNYAIEVELPNKLTTTYHKQLEYKQEMHGIADIITEDLSLFDRVFYQFRKLSNNK
jgi:multidrug resistance efflux pump